MFNPADFGFKPIDDTTTSHTRRDYCYLRRRVKDGIVLVLDEETTDFCKELFGSTVSVATDENGKIVLYNGKMRKLSKAGGNKRCAISMDVEWKKLTSILGEFKIYEYDSKIYAKGEAILLVPKGSVE